MVRTFGLVLAVSVGMIAAPADAADFSDPAWPCIQRKVERLSLGLMWPYPVSEDLPATPEFTKDRRTLAEALSLRRISLETLEPEVTAFATRYHGDVALLGQVFAQVFTSHSTRRTRIIEGIGTFSLSQIDLSRKIDDMRQQIQQEAALDAPDFDKIDALEEQIDWDQLIYTDRQQSIQYLCETPVLLEKRLYAISQLLMRHAVTD